MMPGLVDLNVRPGEGIGLSEVSKQAAAGGVTFFLEKEKGGEDNGL